MTHFENEKLPDMLDRASELEMARTESAIRGVQAKLKRAQEPRTDGTYEVTECTLCGEDIGQGRLDAAPNNLICFECATHLELKAKRPR